MSPRGKLSPKQYLHDNSCVKTPPNIGPTTAERPNMDEIPAIQTGRFDSGTTRSMISIPPVKRKDAAAPATALPLISMIEWVAVAHMTDPTMRKIFSNTAEIDEAGSLTLEEQ